MKKMIKIGLMALAPFAFTGCYMTTVDSGQAGVEVVAGEVNQEAISTGFHFSINPLADIDMFNTKVKALIMNDGSATQPDTAEIIYDRSVGILTTKSLEVPIDMVVNYSIAKTCAPDIRIKYGVDTVYDTKIIIPKVRSVSRDVIGKADVYEMNKNREIYSNGIEAGLNKEFEDIFGAGCVTVTTASIQHIYIPPVLKESIMKKVQMNEEVSRKRLEIDKTVAEAEQRVAEENGKAEAKRIDAQGIADALKITSDAKAYSNRVINDSLTPQLIVLETINKWNGITPRFVGSEDSQFILPLENQNK